MRFRLLAIVFCFTVLCACDVRRADSGPLPEAAGPKAPISANDERLARAFNNRERHLQVEGTGTVTQLLEDDNEGSRHQRFIVRLGTGQTLLIAHNVDLAPRIASLEVGDEVAFFGEYEWNSKGGIIHWTHHDPKRLHTAGWLKHKGRVYQ